MATRELRDAGHEHFAIDAGGDLYLGGLNDDGEQWTVGIRHPVDESEIIDSVVVSNAAVCTSGNYLRGEHILDPLLGTVAAGIASATVIAPLAMVADGLATAAFVLGPERGVSLLERHGVQGLLITPSLERFCTR
jgi:FAD:protein FMN transferase